MVEKDKCFVYIDSSINGISFSTELFTPTQLRTLIYNSPKVTINIFISSNEAFELLWVYSISKLYSLDKPLAVKSHLYSQTTANIFIVTSENISRFLHDIHGLCYSDIAEYYKMKVSFGKTVELLDKFT